MEDRVPRLARARCFPDATEGKAGVERTGLTDDARHGGHASRAERAEVAPGEAGEQRGWDARIGWGGEGDEGDQKNRRASEHGFKSRGKGCGGAVMIRSSARPVEYEPGNNALRLSICRRSAP